MANQRLHANAAIALLFHVEHRWRGVGDPSRWRQRNMHRTCAMLLGGWLLVTVTGCRTPLSHPPNVVSELHGNSHLIRTVRLDDLNSLVVRGDSENHRVTTDIVFDAGVVKSLTIRNTLLESVSVEEVSLDPSNSSKDYLIRIPDRNSTFGAVTGIIVYRLQWWEFFLIPDDRFRVEDIDSDTIAELICDRIQEKTFSFAHGVLHEKSSR